MKKSTVSNIRKKRIGRPPVNAVPVLVRIPPAEIEPIDDWREKYGVDSRPEAIRRLVELGLTVRTKPQQAPAARAARAKELAGQAIDKLGDPAAHPEERAQRRRRLTKGPEEFREARIDRPKVKPNDQTEEIRRATGRGRGSSKSSQSGGVETDDIGQPSRTGIPGESQPPQSPPDEA